MKGIDCIIEPILFIGQIEESKYKEIKNFLNTYHACGFKDDKAKNLGAKCMFKYFFIKYFIRFFF